MPRIIDNTIITFAHKMITIVILIILPFTRTSDERDVLLSLNVLENIISSYRLRVTVIVVGF